ncbi:ATPase [Corynebacterium sp. 13CS0277]|uniref:TadA family conjugal transfer-associated ATPase n=1 Tax=Corynebacterium sp. 13CS0277 TaxID=2071994 RepID=UPI000D032FBD|nr:TadA family conjugal transfer-associated ATPase [Corynebacterium sp. 13CS0277]PRQ12166.1 ATPase [Corynebacterium sp. 13CS0277]
MHTTDTLFHTLRQRLATADTIPAPHELAALIRAEAGLITDQDVLDLMTKLTAGAAGLGPLEPLLTIPGLTDILVSGPARVRIATTGSRHLADADITFASDADVRELATRLAHSCGRRLDDAHPYADGRITRADGTSLRIHAILNPPALTGTCLSIRVLNTATTTLADLEARGTMPPHITRFLHAIVDTRQNFLISGGTGSGKTTLLAALIAHMDPRQRILAVEDTAELAPNHPGLVTLTSRAANTEGHGEITMSTLITQCLRMRPDRIIVGEIRGREVVDLLTALNTGHSGGGGTVHANSIRDIPSRLEALASLGGLTREATHSHMHSALNVSLNVAHTPTGRKLTHIGQLTQDARGLCHMSIIWDHRHGPTDTWRELNDRLLQEANQ